MMKKVKKVIGFLFCLAFCTAMAIGIPHIANAEETFIGINDQKSGKLDWSISADGHLAITGEGDYETVNIEDMAINGPNWLEYRKYIRTAEVNVKKITSTVYMFAGCKSLTNVDLNNLDTSNVTNMSAMFWNCISLSYINLSKFNTSSVTQMGAMFSECISLSNLNLSKFDTSKVIEMQALFYNCKNLKSLDLSKFNTSSAELMGYIFAGCSSLTNLDLSNFNTSNVTQMPYMFIECSGLTSLNLSNFDTSNVMYMGGMFDGCSSLTSLDLSNFDDSKIILLDYFKLDYLNSLEEIRFFKNSTREYTFPSSADYRWIDEDNKTCTETAKLDRKMTYTRVNKDYVPPVVTPTPVPSAIPTLKPSAEPSTEPSAEPSMKPSTEPFDTHIFNDYNYNKPVTDSELVIYGNGKTQTINGKKINSKLCTVYTDILASYKYTPNNNGIIKPSVGKVIVGITKSDIKPTLSSKNKITDTSASKIAKARIKNGQITVTAVGKEGGLVYLWVMDTGSKGVSACCPINVKLAPTKLEVQNTSGSKITKNTKLENGKTLDVCVAGFVGSTKADDVTYTTTVASKYQNYVSVTLVEGSTNKFKINAKGLKNNKDTKVIVTFKCDQNGKKTNLPLTITK